jgi:hypothetical protein
LAWRASAKDWPKPALGQVEAAEAVVFYGLTRRGSVILQSAFCILEFERFRNPHARDLLLVFSRKFAYYAG